MSHRPLLVTAHLASPLAGEAPRLDALLEWSLAPFHDHAFPAPDGGHFRLTRAGPAPPQGAFPIGLTGRQLGPWRVYKCSAPIMPACHETVEHVGKRIVVEHAGLLAPNERKVVSTTNSWTKSYRLPLRVRAVSLVRWACVGDRRTILKAMRDVKAVGKKVADGYGRVAKWEAEESDVDLSWFAPHDSGTLLMRVLPLGDWLPQDLLGARRSFGACTPPYWHPERATEIVEPC